MIFLLVDNRKRIFFWGHTAVKDFISGFLNHFNSFFPPIYSVISSADFNFLNS